MASSAPAPPRLSSFSIQNFRTFRDRQVIPLEGNVTVFHGPTGSGKSTALAALDTYLRTLAVLHETRDGATTIPWNMTVNLERPDPLISERDRPIQTEPTVLAASFADDPLTSLEVHYTPAAEKVEARMTWTTAPTQADAMRAAELAAALQGVQAVIRAAQTQSSQTPRVPIAQRNNALRALQQQLAVHLGKEKELTAQINAHGQAVNQARHERLQQFLFPFGSIGRPLAILDARRRPRWLPRPQFVSPAGRVALLAPELAAQLYSLQTSRIASDRARWRAFADMLTRFPTLRGATITLEAGNQAPALVVEHSGRIVLDLEELSSGEQELAALTATLLLSRAGIVAIEEPEMGLDGETQILWRGVCESQREAGFVRQMIFESHAVNFDGPQVVRFSRDPDGATKIEVTPSSADDETTRNARKAGAEVTFVSVDGYTKIPEAMRQELGSSEKGANVWFLRGVDTWEAWPENKLERLLSEKGK